ncbi:PQQ-dependent sugar dehydrogenase [Sphingomonas qomolangmaensis]|uniref:PQQ-dependent sugar dehydrogenase n=1 Tax=Sphingomonas qomolangmaensis TaxID=2918765 RepID=A0ABY5L8E5_9SPHN|nr:PQQ-dependent sugar dehydrogenase [Sphingomonas qomolangmaensis]UUL82069.1 PQQ-dependent sugar dehydrogenase [Sphingomonas qomolangmaensis]
MSTRTILFTTIASASLLACSAADQGNATVPANAATAAASPAGAAQAGLPFAITPVAAFDAPWAMTFLPDGRMLVTQKAGQLMLVSADGKTKTPLTGIPAVDSEGQGGLMDVVLHPQFAQNRMVYFSFSEAGPGGKGVALARGVLQDGDKPALQDVSVIFRASPYVEGDGHYSGRIAFAPDGQHLFFTNGERQKFDPAQDPKATLGKVLRLTLDGKPAGDPALTAKGFNPAVWSYGHRNLLGIAFDGAGNLWEQEMGPMGGDEINLIQAGKNYGYPIVSDGDHYDGRDIPNHDTRPEFEKYKVNWTPVIAPAGLIAYSGAMFPEWQGDLFVGGLASEALVRIDVNGTQATKGDQWGMNARIREVEQGPDGALYVLEDGEGGRLLKLTKPA